MGLFGKKIYPTHIDGQKYYFEDDMYFDLGTRDTNIPRNKQRYCMIPATNPEQAGTYMSVKNILYVFKHLHEWTIGIPLPEHAIEEMKKKTW